MRWRSRMLAAGLALLGGFPVLAEEEVNSAGAPYFGRTVQSVLEHFRQQGYAIAYSSQLVPPDLVVLKEPGASLALEIVSEILRPHGLEVKLEDGVYLIIRAARGPPAGQQGTLLLFVRGPESRSFDAPVAVSTARGLAAVEALGPGLWQVAGLVPGTHELTISSPGYLSLRRQVLMSPGEPNTLHVRMDAAPFELQALSVSASRYVLFSNSQFYVDQRAIQSLPGNGDDPLRAAHRLPGAAAGGWSAQTHFRGGGEDESAIFLNGLRLFDPFHVRDYHNVFSAIDARSISGVEAWTGGFPAAYGDRMSGILLLQSRKPDRPRHFELGVSVFNTSLLASGYDESDRFDWLVSARRSNLGAVLDREEHGKPSYHDIFASMGYTPNERTHLSFNLLRASDQILAITEHLVDDREESTSDTRNTQAWIQLEQQLPGENSLSAVLWNAAFSNRRKALTHDPEQLLGEVSDDRDVDVSGLRLDFVHSGLGRHILSWGAEIQDKRAKFDYRAQAEYRGFYLAYPGVEESLLREVQAMPSGNSRSIYVSDRWQATPRLVVDAGLRWDHQSWIEGGDGQFSPRLGLLYTPGAASALRLTWGRYHQSQQIEQLQVEDGVERYYPAQRADHLIAGYSRHMGSRWSIRAEVFEKRYAHLRPRFENLLDPIPLIGELEPDRIRLDPSSARARGMELTLEYDFEALTGWASYTLSRATDRINGVNEPRNWDQRHALQAGLAWRHGPWELGFALKAHSGWPTTSATLTEDEDGELLLEPGSRNARHLNSFVNLDLRVARQWRFERSRLTAYFELNNALDRKNECCVDYDVEDDEAPELERSVDHWLGISPALGLLWEF